MNNYKILIYEKMKRELGSNSKSKSIIIDGQLHYRFKMHCKGKSMKIGAVIEDLIKLYLTNQKEVQKMIDELKEREVTHV